MATLTGNSGKTSTPSEPHSYLVLKENLTLPQGSLVELKSGSYCAHTHLWAYVHLDPLAPISFAPDELAPLSEEECVLLDAIGASDFESIEDAARYKVYSAPGKLVWGVGLKIGDTVLARLPDRGQRDPSTEGVLATCVIRSIGVEEKYFGSDERCLFGVEITDPQYYGYGDTDGTYGANRHFSCKDNHGLFVTLADIEKLLPSLFAPSASWAPQPPPPPSHSYLLLEEIEPYSRGALMELCYDGMFIGHSHLWYTEIISIRTEAAAPLSRSECVLLDAIAPGFRDDESRYTVYSTPGKLAWGVGLKVGDTVLARLPDDDDGGMAGHNEYTTAVIRAVGVDEQLGRRTLFGVEIMDPRYYGRGNTAGTYERVEYFFCDSARGLFLTITDIEQHLHTYLNLPTPSLQQSHSYLMLEATPPYSRGALVERDREGKYSGHSHLQYIATDSVFSEAVAPLTEKECMLLDAISFAADDDAARYVVYSTPGKLAWGEGLKVGDTVLARVSLSAAEPQDQYRGAVVRSIGIEDEFSRHSLFGVEITEKKFYGCGDSDGTYTYNNSTKRYFSCKKKRGLFLSLADINPPPSSTALNTALQERVSQLEREMRDQTQRIRQLSSSEGRLRQEVTRLEGELREKEAMPAMIQREAREVAARQVEQEMKDKDDTITGLERNLQYKEAAISGLVDQLMRYRELHMAELDQARQETEHYQHLLREEQAQRQQLVTRIRGVIGDVRGDAASPQALELWELPREEVHISQTILGTGGWGYVARGTFRGQKVAVKCLHQGILSQHNETKLRREISIMSQVRHPNLLLLIGAVLTAEGRGPLIVTELLDRSLRSAYEDGLLEERSKVPVLRDVSSALTYLHSHRTPIIHRDVSSSNVLLEAVRDGQWKGKLSDFGSANLSHLASTPAEGAAVYAAPEVSTEDRSRQTPKIDVYSFGVLMCEVCLCRFPPERREFSSMLNEVRGRAPHMFPLSRDCTSHAHQNRPQMKLILQWLTRLKET